MKKLLIGIFSLSIISLVQAYVPQERLFNHLLIPYEKREDGVTSSRVLLVRGMPQFYRDVITNKKPVVVKVFSQARHDFVRSIYQDIADSFKGKVSFIGMDIEHNENIIRAIMMRLRVLQVNMPLFLFFKQGTLILPLMSGFVNKENLVERIEKQLLSKEVPLKGGENPALGIVPGSKQEGVVADEEKQKKGVPSDEDETSSAEKIESIGEKFKKWLFGLHDVSKEVKAYTVSKKWRERKRFMQQR